MNFSYINDQPQQQGGTNPLNLTTYKLQQINNLKNMRMYAQNKINKETFREKFENESSGLQGTEVEETTENNEYDNNTLDDHTYQSVLMEDQNNNNENKYNNQNESRFKSFDGF